MTGVDVEQTRALLDKAQIENGEVAADRSRYRMSVPANPDRDTDLIIGDALTSAESLVAAVERAQAQVDKALEILDRYNHSDDGDLPECAPEDRWRLYRDLLATLNPEALEIP